MRGSTKFLVCTVAALVAVTLAGQVAAAPDPVVRPDWAAIFGPDGKVVSLNGGVDAFFMEDKISDSLGLDMSVPAAGGAPIIYNGVVARADDLGNGYAWATKDAGGNLQIYAGAERLVTPGQSWVEFEFNQNVIQANSGAPWPITGQRNAGDILVRVYVTDGCFDSASFMWWDGASYQIVAEIPAGGQSGPDVAAYAGVPPILPLAQEVWDAAGNPVVVPQPDSFIEVGFNVAPLAGANVEFTSVQVRTPGDVILDGFRQIGYWAHRGQGGGL